MIFHSKTSSEVGRLAAAHIHSKAMFFMQIIDFSKEHIAFYRIKHFWRNSLIFHEQRPFFIPFWINMQSSVHRERGKRGFCIKITILEWKINDFVETIRTLGFVKTWFFLWKITNFSMNFRWKWTILQHFLLHLYTWNNKNDDFESKNTIQSLAAG